MQTCIWPSLVNALLYSQCIHKIGLRICVPNFLSDLVTACNKSRQKTRVTNLLSKALQDNTHEMIDNNNDENTKMFVYSSSIKAATHRKNQEWHRIHIHVVRK